MTSTEVEPLESDVTTEKPQSVREYVEQQNQRKILKIFFNSLNILYFNPS